MKKNNPTHYDEIDFFEDVGHFIMMERPSEFNEWLELQISKKN